MSAPARTDANMLLRRLESGPVVAIAPHPDDLALSVGGLIRLLGGTQLLLVTIFTRSRWAPMLGSDDVELVSRVRAGEDRRYAATIGADWRDGGLPDSSARGVPDDRWMQPPEIDDPLRRTVSDIVEDALRSSGPCYVLCPLALGSHVDHVLTRDAVVAACAGMAHPVFYEDIPYALDLSSTGIADHVGTVAAGAHPVTLDIGPVFTEKLAGVRLYESQIRATELAATHGHARRLAVGTTGHGERVWVMNEGHGRRDA